MYPISIWAGDLPTGAREKSQWHISNEHRSAAHTRDFQNVDQFLSFKRRKPSSNELSSLETRLYRGEALASYVSSDWLALSYQNRQAASLLINKPSSPSRSHSRGASSDAADHLSLPGFDPSNGLAGHSLRQIHDQDGSLAAQPFAGTAVETSNLEARRNILLHCPCNRCMPHLFRSDSARNRYRVCDTSGCRGIAGVIEHLNRVHHIYFCGKCLSRFDTTEGLSTHRPCQTSFWSTTVRTTHRVDESCDAAKQKREFKWRHLYSIVCGDDLVNIHEPSKYARVS